MKKERKRNAIGMLKSKLEIDHNQNVKTNRGTENKFYLFYRVSTKEWVKNEQQTGVSINKSRI